MFGITPLTPAYGRDYKSKAAVKADFDANLDFLTAGGQYINKVQVVELGLKRVEIRYKKLTQLTVIKV